MKENKDDVLIYGISARDKAKELVHKYLDGKGVTIDTIVSPRQEAKKRAIEEVDLHRPHIESIQLNELKEWMRNDEYWLRVGVEILK